MGSLKDFIAKIEAEMKFYDPRFVVNIQKNTALADAYNTNGAKFEEDAIIQNKDITDRIQYDHGMLYKAVESRLNAGASYETLNLYPKVVISYDKASVSASKLRCNKASTLIIERIISFFDNSIAFPISNADILGLYLRISINNYHSGDVETARKNLRLCEDTAAEFGIDISKVYMYEKIDKLLQARPAN